ncbi:hypothetical protein D3C71_1718830 [compost metagenome]
MDCPRRACHARCIASWLYFDNTGIVDDGRDEKRRILAVKRRVLLLLCAGYIRKMVRWRVWSCNSSAHVDRAYVNLTINDQANAQFQSNARDSTGSQQD